MRRRSLLVGDALAVGVRTDGGDGTAAGEAGGKHGGRLTRPL